jgi:hypothetical protein
MVVLPTRLAVEEAMTTVRNVWTVANANVPYDEEPIHRELCLATVWLNCAGIVLDPAPTTCALRNNHPGWHRAANSGTSGPEITWEDSQ